jgi:hypothetical protein
MQSKTQTRSRDARRRVRPLFSLALLLCLIVLAGCQVDDAQKHIGRQLTKLHEQMNGEETNAIWTAADDGFRQGITKQEFTRLFIRNHRKLGDAGSGLVRDTEIDSTFKGTYISMWLISDFANDPDVHEHVVWFGKDGVYKLYRYDVSSKLLQ